jgi:hypothetical protein
MSEYMLAFFLFIAFLLVVVSSMMFLFECGRNDMPNAFDSSGLEQTKTKSHKILERMPQ